MALGVTVDFTASLVKFSGQMDTMAGKLDQFQKRAETMSSRVNSAFSALGIGLSAAGLVSFVKNGIDAADALNDLADRSGIAIEKLAGLEYAVKLGDTSMEAFVAASNKLSINVAKNAESFAALGVSAQDPVEQFKQFADVFAAIDDPQQRAAVGAAALGKAYAEMAPLLVRGGDGIQDLIDRGKQLNPITAEQAARAGELNDKIDELTNMYKGFSITLVGPVVEGILATTKAMQFAMEQADKLQAYDFTKAFLGGGSDAAQIEYFKKQIQDLPDQIERQRGKIDRLAQKTGLAKLDASFLGYDIDEERQRLDALVKLKETAESRLDALTKPPAAADSASNVTEAQKSAALALAKAAGDEEDGHKKAADAAKTHASALNSAAKEQSRHAELIAKTVESLKFEISLTGQSVDTQRLLSDIRSATADATAEEAAAIEKLIKTKYDLIEADNILADGEKLAQQQRADSAADNERLRQMFSGENQSMYSQFDDAFKAKGAGIINDKELAKALENISQGYDALGLDAMSASDTMSTYAEQAARNMQSAFADFLFDPFTKGMDGMLEGFITTMGKMAANAASSQIMDMFLGKTGKDGKTDFSSGLISIGFSALGSFFGFANGGIMSSSGPLPLRAYAGGGIANSPQLAVFGEGRMNEAFVPLPDGRSIPVSMNGNGGGGDVQVNTTVTVNGNASNDNAQKLGGMLSAKIREVIVTEKRPGGLLA